MTDEEKSSATVFLDSGQDDTPPASKVESDGTARTKSLSSGFLLYGPDVELTRPRKASVLILAAVSGMLGPLGGFIYSPALALVQADLHTSEVLANLTLTVYSLSLGIAPLAWATTADANGRRPTLLVSGVVTIVGSLGCWLHALSPSIGPFLFWRIVFGCGACAGMSVGAGIIADIYAREERGRAYGLFFLGPILGPVISPPIGGAIAQALGWRYIFLLTTALSVFVFLVSFLFLPETLSKRSDSAGAGAPAASRNPLSALIFLKHPFVALTLYMATVSFASFISFSPLVPRDWPSWYGFSTTAVGFVLMSMGAGMAAGSAFGGWYSDWTMARWRKRRQGVFVAEDRLWSAVPGVVLMEITLLCYGWFSEYRIAWPANIATLVFFGIGQSFIMASLNTYLIDIFSTRAASVSAVGNFLRFTLSSFMPLVVVPAASIGRGWFFTILALLNLIGLVGVGWVLRYGTAVRLARSPWSDVKQVVHATTG
ncbi:MFS general substrate transporter [Gonapodya prolifera JEL478]|uniref:MFS general substrate transporter n=1 Tax=Gonapodya prolifera (strain JEL478) TaxID=1344416 RepID=A0A139AV39_GONPJ|nr:MFS general substrate transporter [Gonapodya prolifera JEL478]|eukprot:KXS20588.1 MFS general substrate transporter [Gonapodya prolifera JEL478]